MRRECPILSQVRTTVTVSGGPGFCILFNLVEFVGELVVPGRIPQGVDFVAVEIFQDRKREAGGVGYFGEICAEIPPNLEKL